MNPDLIERISPNVVRVDVKVGGISGNGSGILIDQKGTILTCEHVVFPSRLQPEDLSVAKKSELPKRAEILNFDEYHDVALLNVE